MRDDWPGKCEGTVLNPWTEFNLKPPFGIDNYGRLLDLANPNPWATLRGRWLTLYSLNSAPEYHKRQPGSVCGSSSWT